MDISKSGLRSSLLNILKTSPWIFAKVVEKINVMSISRRVLTHIGESNVKGTSCFDMCTKKMATCFDALANILYIYIFYDMF